MSGTLLGASLQQWRKTKFSALTELVFGGQGLGKDTHTGNKYDKLTVFIYLRKQ